MPIFPITVGTDGNDNLSNTFGGTIFGLQGNDTLKGGFLGDQLFGGAGDDLLVGNAGDDLLTGGGGADEFRFNVLNPFEGNDAIVDYNPLAGDTITFFADQVATTLLFGGYGYRLFDGLQKADLDNAPLLYGIGPDGFGNVDMTTPYGNSIEFTAFEDIWDPNGGNTWSYATFPGFELI
ncbi:hypothetical protein L1787_10735 [Acuticoccus sp. M5D2P5]|uniref:hypothetical protein n=1 Tax=Acuticoccus kalidii TaxID=2910977 RepID=UPI001F3C4159|nr:hypothetical protein [Acuticoccus kalidii]MCF3933891.1 hypothetical protein [Acuticoccus kalidii]